VNPEAPWPQLQRLEAVTNDRGFELRQRLPVYPEFITPEWIDSDLLEPVRSAVDADGYASSPEPATA
jgi:hypothetical protein